MAEFIISGPVTVECRTVNVAADFVEPQYTLVKEYEPGEIPTVRKLTRCKDCCYYGVSEEGHCEEHDRFVAPIGFCNWGHPR